MFIPLNLDRTLELMDLAAIYQLAPQLTAIESRLALADYDSQFDDDWSRPKSGSGSCFLHASRPHILYSAPLANEAKKTINVYFLLQPSAEAYPTPVNRLTH